MAMANFFSPRAALFEYNFLHDVFSLTYLSFTFGELHFHSYSRNEIIGMQTRILIFQLIY